MNELMRARALHTMVTNTWMNANTEQEFFTAPESQFCQVLRRNSGMSAGQKLLEVSKWIAGVIRTTSWVLMASMASMASMVASMAPMAGMDLMALELKSERECSGLVSTCCIPLRIKPFVLLLFRCPLGTVLLMNLHLAATQRENDGSRSLRRVVKIGGVRAEGSCKIGGERVDGVPHKIVGEIDAGNIEEELVRNELMGSTEKRRSVERRITAHWCYSRVASWRVAAGKTIVLMDFIILLASEVSLVSLVRKWNAMVPRMEMAMILRKLATNVTSIAAVIALTALLMQLALRASRASEDCVAPMVASMAAMALMVVASVALVASMVWVTALKKRELSNGMLRYSPLKTWLCSSTRQAWEAHRSRSSRRVDDVKVKKELMGSQIWAMVVTMARMASMASMVLRAPRATMVLASAALKAPMAGVSAL